MWGWVVIYSAAQYLKVPSILCCSVKHVECVCVHVKSCIVFIQTSFLFLHYYHSFISYLFDVDCPHCRVHFVGRCEQEMSSVLLDDNDLSKTEEPSRLVVELLMVLMSDYYNHHWYSCYNRMKPFNITNKPETYCPSGQRKEGGAHRQAGPWHVKSIPTAVTNCLLCQCLSCPLAFNGV